MVSNSKKVVPKIPDNNEISERRTTKSLEAKSKEEVSKPYFKSKEDSVVLYVEDFSKLNIPHNSVDFIITSPRYNAQIDYDGVEDYTSKYKYIEEMVNDLKKMQNFLKEGGHIMYVMPILINHNSKHSPEWDWGATYKPNPYLAHIISKIDMLAESDYAAGIEPLWLVGILPWIKPSGNSDRFAAKIGSRSNRPTPACNYEMLVMWRKGFGDRNGKKGKQVDTKFFKMMNFPWEIAPETTKAKLNHPVPYPEELVEQALYCFTMPGDIVFDPFLGSGTTMKVALDMKRKFVGNDISEKYIKQSIKRCGLNVQKVW